MIQSCPQMSQEPSKGSQRSASSVSGRCPHPPSPQHGIASKTCSALHAPAVLRPNAMPCAVPSPCSQCHYVHRLETTAFLANPAHLPQTSPKSVWRLHSAHPVLPVQPITSYRPFTQPIHVVSLSPSYGIPLSPSYAIPASRPITCHFVPANPPHSAPHPGLTPALLTRPAPRRRRRWRAAAHRGGAAATARAAR